MNRPAEEHPVGHATAFQLQEIQLGLASDGERGRVAQHLAVCPRCAALQVRIDRACEEFVTEVLPRQRPRISPALDSAAAAGHPRRWPGAVRVWLAASLLLPAAGALLVWRGAPAGPAEVGDLQLKGGAGLTIAARRGNRVFRAGPGQPLRPGDQIRFVLTGVRWPFVLIASIDGGGRANIYFPYEGPRSEPVSGGAGARAEGATVEVPGSIVLDDSPGPERIFALFSRTPLEAQLVREALRALDARGPAVIRAAVRLEIPAAEQATLLLEKAPR